MSLTKPRLDISTALSKKKKPTVRRLNPEGKVDKVDKVEKVYNLPAGRGLMGLKS